MEAIMRVNAMQQRFFCVQNPEDETQFNWMLIDGSDVLEYIEGAPSGTNHRGYILEALTGLSVAAKCELLWDGLCKGENIRTMADVLYWVRVRVVEAIRGRQYAVNHAFVSR